MADTESVFLSRVLDREIRQVSQVSVCRRGLFVFTLQPLIAKKLPTAMPFHRFVLPLNNRPYGYSRCAPAIPLFRDYRE